MKRLHTLSRSTTRSKRESRRLPKKEPSKRKRRTHSSNGEHSAEPKQELVTDAVFLRMRVDSIRGGLLTQRLAGVSWGDNCVNELMMMIPIMMSKEPVGCPLVEWCGAKI